MIKIIIDVPNDVQEMASATVVIDTNEPLSETAKGFAAQLLAFAEVDNGADFDERITYYKEVIEKAHSLGISRLN